MRGFRPERVGSLLREVLSEAICFRLQDPRIEPLTTITRVEVTNDLSVARIYFTVPGGDVAERRTLAAIEHATGFLQRLAAKEVQLRSALELRFEIDKSVKIARETLQLIQQNRLARGEPVEDEVPADATESSSRENEDEEDQT